MNKSYVLNTDRGAALWWRGGFMVVLLADVVGVEHVLPMWGDWRTYVYLRGGQRVRAQHDQTVKDLYADLAYRQRGEISIPLERNA